MWLLAVVLGVFFILSLVVGSVLALNFVRLCYRETGGGRVICVVVSRRSRRVFHLVAGGRFRIGAKVLARFLWWFWGPGFCRLWACVSLPVLKRASEIRGSFLRLRKLKGDV